MKSIFTTMLMVLLFIAAGWQATAEASEKPSFQVIVEGGLALPQGDLSDDYFTAPLGFGATTGFEAGLRMRYYLNGWLSLSPAFHLFNPGNVSSENDELGEYSLQANSYRYSVEIMLSKREAYLGFRPFLAAGFGLYTNRYKGFTKHLVKEFDRSVHTPGYSLRAGLRVNDFEFSGLYHINRFKSFQFFDGAQENEYNWDNVTLRIGWIIPFTD